MNNQDKWWETCTIYQIYPLSFADQNGDGEGDLKGIIAKLDYLNSNDPNHKSLGIGAIWLNPIYTSPRVDNGYDVSDYCMIDEKFGGMGDFETLLEEAHKRKIKVIMDMVLNHSSDQHPWFLESRSSKNNPKRDWYIWKDPAPNGDVPNNWVSFTGGSGWEYDQKTGQYYYHTFHKAQPDLNWQNPEVREAIAHALRFWLDKGVDGFRLDAFNVFAKDEQFRNNPMKYDATDKSVYRCQNHLYNKNVPAMHDYLQEIRAVIDSYGGDRVILGETFIDSPLYDTISYYGKDNNEVHLPFSFEFTLCPWSAGYVQREIEKFERLSNEGNWPNYFWNNHDIARHLSRWDTSNPSVDSNSIAKVAAAVLLTVRGTPIMYYGEEIGMKSREISNSESQDRIFLNDKLKSSRDGSRTPMQWDDSAHAGFSFGQDVKPWITANRDYVHRNVKAQMATPDSIWNFYRELLSVRKEYSALQKGSWRTLIDYPDDYLVYLRETDNQNILVILNFANRELPLEIDHRLPEDEGVVLFSNRLNVGDQYTLSDVIEPYEVTIVELR
jgi:alpha-glucosidase